MFFFLLPTLQPCGTASTKPLPTEVDSLPTEITTPTFGAMNEKYETWYTFRREDVNAIECNCTYQVIFMASWVLPQLRLLYSSPGLLELG